MAPEHVDVYDSEAADRVVGRLHDGSDIVVLVHLTDEVPAWLGDLVRRVDGAHVAVSLPTSVPSAGWEIGVLTAVLSLGITDVRGADPVRLRRVEAVVAALAEAAPTEVSS